MVLKERLKETALVHESCSSSDLDIVLQTFNQEQKKLILDSNISIVLSGEVCIKVLPLYEKQARRLSISLRNEDQDDGLIARVIRPGEIIHLMGFSLMPESTKLKLCKFSNVEPKLICWAGNSGEKFNRFSSASASNPKLQITRSMFGLDGFSIFSNMSLFNGMSKQELKVFAPMLNIVRVFSGDIVSLFGRETDSGFMAILLTGTYVKLDNDSSKHPKDIILGRDLSLYKANSEKVILTFY